MRTYLLRIYVAEPGTPVWGSQEPSLPGHLYYSIDDGTSSRSYGFAPMEHGNVNGPGMVYRTDEAHYQNPRYERALEITEQQYKALREFGDNPRAHGFDTHYRDTRNNCVDFTWAALNHAGLHTTNTLTGKPVKDHEGSLKPADNVDDIQRIIPPIPGSPLNHETFNPPPPKDLFRRLLSDDQPSGIPGNAMQKADHELLGQIRNHVRELDLAHGRTFDERSERISHSLLSLAKENGLSRVDHVVLSRACASAHAAENIFVVQGRPDDPAHLRAHMQTEVAAQTPVAESNQRLEAINQQVAQEQSQNPALMQQREAHNAPTMRA